MREKPESALRRLIPRASSNLRYEEEDGEYVLYETGRKEPLGRLYERELATLVVEAVSWLLPAFNRITTLTRRLAGLQRTNTRLIRSVQNLEGRKKVAGSLYDKEDNATTEEDHDDES